MNALLRGAAADEYPDLPGPAATAALVLLARAYGVTPEVRGLAQQYLAARLG